MTSHYCITTATSLTPSSFALLQGTTKVSPKLLKIAYRHMRTLALSNETSCFSLFAMGERDVYKWKKLGSLSTPQNPCRLKLPILQPVLTIFFVLLLPQQRTVAPTSKPATYFQSFRVSLRLLQSIPHSSIIVTIFCKFRKTFSQGFFYQRLPTCYFWLLKQYVTLEKPYRLRGLSIFSRYFLYP